MSLGPYPFSVKESPRSLDGRFVLLHIAGLYSGVPLNSLFDSSRVRVFLAGLVVPPFPLEELNFFGLGTALDTQPPAASASLG